MPVHPKTKARQPRLARQGSRIRQQSAPEALASEIAAPEQPVAAIIFPVTVPLSASGEGLQLVAAGLQDRGFATFLAELLAPEETDHGYHSFDFEMLADRIVEVTERLRRKSPFKDLPIGYFGTSTDAAAIATAAADPDCPAGALVMYEARPELVPADLSRVHAPTLFIVEDDELAVRLNRKALAKLCCPGDLAVLEGAGKSLGSPEIASQAAHLAGRIFASNRAADF